MNYTPISSSAEGCVPGGCPVKLDLTCVFYHYNDPAASNLLGCIGLNNGASGEQLIERIALLLTVNVCNPVIVPCYQALDPTLPNNASIGQLMASMQKTLCNFNVPTSVDTNFANTNLTFNAARTHNAAGFSLKINSLSTFEFNGVPNSIRATTGGLLLSSTVGIGLDAENIEMLKVPLYSGGTFQNMVLTTHGSHKFVELVDMPNGMIVSFGVVGKNSAPEGLRLSPLGVLTLEAADELNGGVVTFDGTQRFGGTKIFEGAVQVNGEFFVFQGDVLAGAPAGGFTPRRFPVYINPIVHLTNPTTGGDANYEQYAMYARLTYTEGAVSTTMPLGGVIRSQITFEAGFQGHITSAAMYEARKLDLVGGSGGTIANFVGFVVEDLVSGTLTNIGFRSVISAGTGKWNAYMEGTASNYFKGNVLIGDDNDTTTKKLRVIGDSAFSGTIYAPGLDEYPDSAPPKIIVFNAGMLQKTTLSLFLPPFIAFTNVTNVFTKSQVINAPFNAITGRDGPLLLMQATMTQSGDAAYTMLRINSIESGGLGTGTNYALDMQVNGVQKMAINSYGGLEFKSTWIGRSSGFATIDISQSIAPISGTVYAGVRVFPTITGTSFNYSNVFGYYGRVDIGSYTGIVTNLIMYYAIGNTAPASTVTNWFGFNVGNTATGTNNYGFYSSLSAFTNRWNLYFAGNATSYMAGNLQLGSVTASTTSTGPEILQVTGRALFTDWIRATGLVLTAGDNTTFLSVVLNNASKQFELANVAGGTGGGGGITALAPIGSTPNTEGATITGGNTLNLQPASATFGGVVTTSPQTFGGNKTFNGAVAVNGTSLSYIGTNNIDNLAPVFFFPKINVDNGTGISDPTFTQYGMGTKLIYNSGSGTSFFGGVIGAQLQLTTGFHGTIDSIALFETRDAIIDEGADGIIHDLVGFVADRLSKGTVINIGFKGLVQSGPHNWNLYMDGTASNYLLGKVLLGNLTDTGEQLQVTGTSLFTGNVKAINTYSAALGIEGPLLSLTANVSQSGTAGYTGLKMNFTETTTGSGNKRFFEFYLNSAIRAQLDTQNVLLLTDGMFEVTGTTSTANTNSRLYLHGTMTPVTTQSQMINAAVTYKLSADLANLYAQINIVSLDQSSFNVPIFRGIYSKLTLAAGYTGTVADAAMFWAAVPTISGGTITSLKAFRGDIASGPERWNLYMSGTASNYLAGMLQIGNTLNTGEKLQVTGSSIFTGTVAMPIIPDIVGTPSRKMVVWVGGFLQLDAMPITGGTGGITSLGAIGSTPNLAGATITGSVLNLEPASPAFGGVVTTSAQSFAGDKRFDARVMVLKPLANDTGEPFQVKNTFAASTAVTESLVSIEATNTQTGAAGYSIIKANLIDVTSGTGGFDLLLLQVGGAPYFNVNKYGTVGINGVNDTTAVSLVALSIGQSFKPSSPTVASLYAGVKVLTTIDDPATLPGGVVVTAGFGYFGRVDLTSRFTGTLNELSIFYASNTQNSAPAGATAITNWYGFRTVSNGTGVTNYSFHTNMNASANTRWAFYSAGTAPNFFAARIQLGNTNNTGEMLQVTGTSRFTDKVMIFGLGSPTDSGELLQVKKTLSGASGLETLVTIEGNINQTGSATYNLFKINMIETQASPGTTSTLMDLRINGLTRFSFNQFGSISHVGISLNPSTSVYGMNNTTTYAPTSGTVTNLSTYRAQNIIDGTANVTNVFIFSGRLDLAASYSGVITDFMVYFVPGSLNAIPANVTNWYGFRVSTNAVAVNHFGFHGGITVGANRWNLYMAGSAANYLSGNLQIGSATATVANEKLQVTGTSLFTASVKMTGLIDFTGAYKSIVLNTSTNQLELATITGGGGGGIATLAAVGSAPNANAATLTGTVLNLEPATAAFPGVVTIAAQTFAGAKRFNDQLIVGVVADTGELFQVKNAYSGTGSVVMSNLDATVNQSGAGAYTMLKLTVTETAVGTGDKFFVNMLNGVDSRLAIFGYGGIEFRGSWPGTAAGVTSINLLQNFTGITAATHYAGVRVLNKINSTSAAITTVYGFFSRTDLGTTNTGTFTDMVNYQAAGPTYTTGFFVNWYGVRVSNVQASTNTYAFSTNQAAGTGLRWAFYASGSAYSHMMGGLMIGSNISTGSELLQVTGLSTFIGNVKMDGVGASALNLVGTSVDVPSLNITTTVSGADGFGNLFGAINAPSLLSTVANALAFAFSSVGTLISTGGSGPTVTTYGSYFSRPVLGGLYTGGLPSVVHFYASTFTNFKSTIPSQIGFFVENLTSATLNYGFYGNVSAAAGKWNVYMAGGASNFLAGALQIGSSTNLNSEMLQVTGTSVFTSTMKATGLGAYTTGGAKSVVRNTTTNMLETADVVSTVWVGITNLQTVTLGGTQYMLPIGMANPNTTEGTRTIGFGIAGTLIDIRVFYNGTQGAGGMIVKLRKGSFGVAMADTALAVSIPPGSYGTTDISNSFFTGATVAVAAGDFFSIKLDNTGGAANSVQIFNVCMTFIAIKP